MQTLKLTELTSERVISNKTGSKQGPLRGGCKMLSSSNTPLRSLRNPETNPFVMNSFSTSGQNLHCRDPAPSERKETEVQYLELFISLVCKTDTRLG